MGHGRLNLKGLPALGIIMLLGSEIPALNQARGAEGRILLPPERDFAGYASCDSPGCTTLPFTLPGQYKLIADCLSGPDAPTPGQCACADVDYDGHVGLMDFAVYQNFPLYLCYRQFEIRQFPGLGYCPQPGTLFEAALIPAIDGSRVLTGSFLEIGDQESDRCVPEGYYDSNCFIAILFLGNPIDPVDFAILNSLLQQIPPLQYESCNFAYDPCVIVYIDVPAKEYDNYCYGSEYADYYRASIQAVFDFVTQLATQN